MGQTASRCQHLQCEGGNPDAHGFKVGEDAPGPQEANDNIQLLGDDFVAE